MQSILRESSGDLGFLVASAEHPERGLQTVLETGSIEGDDAPEAMRAAWNWLAQRMVEAAVSPAGLI